MMIVEQYIALSKDLVEKYGNLSIVLLQVGSFYEMYGLAEEGSDVLVGSRIRHVAMECDLLIAKKAQTIIPLHPLPCTKHQVHMAGFGLPQLDKYVRRFASLNYTIAIYDQKERVPGEIVRELREIISPGTFVEVASNCLTNNAMCISLSGKSGKLVSASVAVFDMVTGENRVEVVAPHGSSEGSILDNLDRVTAIASPIEILFVSTSFDLEWLSKCARSLGLSQRKLHIIGSDSAEARTAKLKCAAKQTYQRDVLVQCYSGLTNDVVGGLMREVDGDLTALVMLIDFVREHNGDLIRGLTVPVIKHSRGILQMSTHSLSQLNILSIDGHKGKKLSSVADLVDCSVTKQGSRSIRERLFRPLSSVADINERLELASSWRTEDKWRTLRDGLVGIGDFQRVHRLCTIGKLQAGHVSQMKVWLGKTLALKVNWEANCSTERFENLGDSLKLVADGFVSKFADEKCAGMRRPTLDRLLKISAADVMLFNKGVDADCDAYYTDLCNAVRELNDTVEACNQVLQQSGEKRTKRQNTLIQSKPMCVVVDKEGPYICGTKRRLDIIAAFVQKGGFVDCVGGSLSVCNLPGSRSTYVLKSDYLDSLSKKTWDLQKRLAGAVMRKWDELCGLLSSLATHTALISSFVSACDIVQNTCYVAETYGYCKPSIEEGNTSCMILKDLRHPLVERINREELYVPNDVSLGVESDVMLLYGTNAVGKSSLIKSIGVCVCLAQAGMYVPCSEATITPYTALFTRILGNDDLFRGLSTFAVEMSELRTILAGADDNSLIIGDELCSGTETSSATAIFATSVEAMHNSRSSAVFATHFHEIASYPEIKALSRLCVSHMAVVFDEACAALVYDRKLRPGAGNNMYGLEVCRALGLPDQFLLRAHELRKKNAINRHDSFQLKPSRYNRSRMRTHCEVCGDASSEVHHLIHQVSAVEGKIGSASIHHCANLLNVCEDCHNVFHKTGAEHRKARRVDGGITLLKT
jgi:DNA mismatch repair protein MutS